MAETGLGCKRSRVQISAARPAFSIFHASQRADAMSANEAVFEGLGNRPSVPSFPVSSFSGGERGERDSLT